VVPRVLTNYRKAQLDAQENAMQDVIDRVERPGTPLPGATSAHTLFRALVALTTDVSRSMNA
jgi:hypothetical protein